jgi:hypothetical protein
MKLYWKVGRHQFDMPEPRWTEFWSGFVALMWGMYVFFMPEELGNRAPYTILGGIATDHEWSFGASLIGLGKMATAVTNERLSRSILNTLGTTFWACLFTGIFLNADSAFPGVVLYLGFSIMDFASLVCLLIILHKIRVK